MSAFSAKSTFIFFIPIIVVLLGSASVVLMATWATDMTWATKTRVLVQDTSTCQDQLNLCRDSIEVSQRTNDLWIRHWDNCSCEERVLLICEEPPTLQELADIGSP